MSTVRPCVVPWWVYRTRLLSPFLRTFTHLFHSAGLSPKPQESLTPTRRLLGGPTYCEEYSCAAAGMLVDRLLHT